jgi:hypothetical protein
VVAAAVRVLDAVTLEEADGERDGEIETEATTLLLGVTERLGVGEIETDEETLKETLGEAVTESETLGVIEGLRVGEMLSEHDTEPVTEVVAATLGVTDAETEADGVDAVVGLSAAAAAAAPPTRRSSTTGPMRSVSRRASEVGVPHAAAAAVTISSCSAFSGYSCSAARAPRRRQRYSDVKKARRRRPARWSARPA